MQTWEKFVLTPSRYAQRWLKDHEDKDHKGGSLQIAKPHSSAAKVSRIGCLLHHHPRPKIIAPSPEASDSQQHFSRFQAIAGLCGERGPALCAEVA